MRSLKSDGAFSPNAVFEDRLGSKFKYHDRIFSRLLEGDTQELGDKSTLCAFLKALMKKGSEKVILKKIPERRAVFQSLHYPCRAKRQPLGTG